MYCKRPCTAVVAFVELQFANPEVKPEQSEMLIVAYAATTVGRCRLTPC